MFNAKAMYLRQLRDIVDTLALAKDAAAEAVAKDPIYFMSWGGQVSFVDAKGSKCSCNVVAQAFKARIAISLLDAEDNGNLIEAAKLLRERMIDTQLRFSGGSSTSAFSNAVEMLEADARRDLLCYFGPLTADAIKSLEEEAAQ